MDGSELENITIDEKTKLKPCARLITTYKDLISEMKTGSSKSFNADEVLASPVCDMLTSFEKTEICKVKKIYFVGTRQTRNLGIPFDDSEGFYNIIPHDHFAYRYELLDVLGKGSFGQTVRAYDHKSHEFVAIKIIKKCSYSRNVAVKEQEILHILRKNNIENKMNVVNLKRSVLFRKHYCLVFELLSVSLYDLMKMNNQRGFSIQVCKKLTYFITESLISLSQLKIRHGDLKPGNILKKPRSCGIKICDFGMSSVVKPGETPNRLIGTRYYRAPEAILGYPSGIESDAWSLGCTLAEFIIGHPLFPGEDERDQLALMIEVIGEVPDHILRLSTRRETFFHRNGKLKYFTENNTLRKHPLGPGTSKYGNIRGYPGGKTLESLVGETDPELIDFLRRLLKWEPSERMTPRATLNHPWIRGKEVEPPGKDTSTTPLRLVRSFAANREIFKPVLLMLQEIEFSKRNEKKLLENVKFHSTDFNGGASISDRINSGF